MEKLVITTRHLRTPPLKRAHTDSVWIVAISGCGSPPGSSRHYRGSRNPRIEEDVGPCAATLTFIPSPYERDRIRAMDTHPGPMRSSFPRKRESTTTTRRRLVRGG